MVLPVFNKRAIDFSWLREAAAEGEERREFRGLLELADEGFALLVNGVLRLEERAALVIALGFDGFDLLLTGEFFPLASAR